MSRDIKFRAWHIVSKIMLSVDKLSFGDPTLIYCKNMTNTANDAVLMQYTGLKDKNGVDIYEGDVVKTSAGKITFIEYFQDGFWLNGRQKGADYELRFQLKFIEVIGNIYENPELIKY